MNKILYPIHQRKILMYYVYKLFQYNVNCKLYYDWRIYNIDDQHFVLKKTAGVTFFMHLLNFNDYFQYLYCNKKLRLI